MMDIQWVSGQYAEDKRIFDSQMEVYEWTDSLYPDFSNYLYREVNFGYATPDEKVIDCLTELLPQWAEYLSVQVIIHKDKILIGRKYLYRIWTSKVEGF